MESGLTNHVWDIAELLGGAILPPETSRMAFFFRTWRPFVCGLWTLCDPSLQTHPKLTAI
jgi:hypothetical protein